MAKRVDKSDEEQADIEAAEAERSRREAEFEQARVRDAQAEQSRVDNSHLFTQDPDASFQQIISGVGEGVVAAAEVEAANKGRLARGEMPIVPGNVQVAQGPTGPSAFGEADGIGEDTQAVKQSQVRRLVNGRVVDHNGERVSR